MTTSQWSLAAATALAVAATPALATQETVALLPVTGINVPDGILAASQDVVKNHLQSAGPYTVVAIPGASNEAEASPALAVERAKAVGASLAVVVRVVRLGNSSQARLTAYRVATGQVMYTDSMTAANPDDLDPVYDRLARGLAAGKPAALTGTIETVTDKEAAALNKRTATHVFGFRLGAAIPANRAGDVAGTSPGGGLFWLYDTRTLLADVTIDWFNSLSGSMFGVGLGGYYPFTSGNVTPYLGGGASYYFVNFGGQSASGLAMKATGGILMNRLSTVQFRMEVGYFYDLFTEQAADGTKHFTNGPIVAIGIGF